MGRKGQAANPKKKDGLAGGDDGEGDAGDEEDDADAGIPRGHHLAPVDEPTQSPPSQCERRIATKMAVESQGNQIEQAASRKEALGRL